MVFAFKIAPKATWTLENFWSELDVKDGYIHMSIKAQVVETAEKWYKGQTGLILVCVDLDKQDNVKWEPSRNNELFPHIYGQVNPQAIIWVKDLTKRGDDTFDFPAEVLL